MDYVGQPSYMWYYVVVTSSFKHAREKFDLRGPMCFRCLIFSMSGHCELLYFLLELSCGECNVISLYIMSFSVNGSVCFVCCVSDICLGVFVVKC